MFSPFLQMGALACWSTSKVVEGASTIFRHFLPENGDQKFHKNGTFFDAAHDFLKILFLTSD